MPNADNLTVKKNDGTTDITYTLTNPSAGDTIAAVWKSQSVGAAQSHQPEFRLSARDMKNGASRETRVTYVYPSIALDTTTGIYTVLDRAFGSTVFNFSKNMKTADVHEAVAQYCNLLKTALVQACMRTGGGAY